MRQGTRRAVDPTPSASAGLPWQEALSAHWRERLGDCAETETVVAWLQSSLAPTTADSYGGHIARFVRWCAVQPDRPPALPTSTATVARWLAADVVRSGRVQAKSLQPYLSALNRIHRDLEFDEPAVGHLMQQVRRGIALSQAARGRKARRVYLPPDVVERVAELAASFSDDVLRAQPAARQLFRAAVAVVLSFVLFVRGATGAALCAEHVRRSDAGLTVSLDHEKGKRVEGTARTLTIPPSAIPGLEALLSRWESLRGDVPDGRCYFAFRHERAAFPSSQIDAWLQLVLSHLGVQPPDGEAWSGHSLRKGAASGAAALDVALHRICYVGGWSIKSRAVFDYIDATCPLTPACRRFFGWLKPM
jgi:hypothetical protein